MYSRFLWLWITHNIQWKYGIDYDVIYILINLMGFFWQITRSNLELQKIERKLRDELTSKSILFVEVFL
jgi:hypothetical protein